VIYTDSLFPLSYVSTNHYSSSCKQQQQQHFQCGSRFRGIWGDPDVNNLTSTSNLVRRAADSKRHSFSCKIIIQ